MLFRSISDTDRLMLEMAYCRAVSESYHWRMDLKILWYTIIISAGFKAPLSVEEARDFLLGYASRSEGGCRLESLS